MSLPTEQSSQVGRLILNSGSSCLYLPTAEITDNICQHSQFRDALRMEPGPRVCCISMVANSGNYIPSHLMVFVFVFCFTNEFCIFS